MKKLLIITFGLSLSTPQIVLSDLNRECSGVAAGVVASMHANEEIAGEEMLKAAVTAARRACVAALQSVSNDLLTFSEPEEATEETSEEKSGDTPTVWEILTQEQEKKPGHERLKKRRQVQ